MPCDCGSPFFYLKRLSFVMLLGHLATSSAEPVDIPSIHLPVVDSNQIVTGQSLLFGPTRLVDSSNLKPTPRRLHSSHAHSSSPRRKKIARTSPEAPECLASDSRTPASVDASSTAGVARERLPVHFFLASQLWFYKLSMTDRGTLATADLASAANMGLSLEANFALSPASKWAYAFHADLRRSTIVAPSDKLVEQSDEYIWDTGARAEYSAFTGVKLGFGAHLEQGIYARALDFTTIRVEQVTRPTFGANAVWNFINWRSFSGAIEGQYTHLMPTKTSVYAIYSGHEIGSTLRIQMLQAPYLWTAFMGYAQQTQANSLTNNSRVDLTMGLGVDLKF